MATFYPGHDRSSGSGQLDHMMIAAHNVGAGFSAPSEGWMLDSGGFRLLVDQGYYGQTPREYVQFVMDCEEEIGGLVAAIAQDYAVADPVVEGVGREPGYDADFVHRSETMERFLETRRQAERLGCEVPIVPVLHGRTQDQYLEEARNLAYWLDGHELVAIGGLKAEKSDADGTPSPTWLRELVRRLRQPLPDAAFHALGIGKKYMLRSEAAPALRRELHSYDSAAWKVRARYADRDQNGTDFATEYANDLQSSTPLFDA